MCGPQIHAVQQLEPAFRGRLAFIHVEVFEDFKPDPSRMRVSQTMREWKLETEPCVFLIDAGWFIRAPREPARGLAPAADWRGPSGDMSPVWRDF